VIHIVEYNNLQSREKFSDLKEFTLYFTEVSQIHKKPTILEGTTSTKEECVYPPFQETCRPFWDLVDD
jgi:hypothetical protein